MKKMIHMLCPECHNIYHNYAIIEVESDVENLRMATCPACIEMACNNFKPLNFGEEIINFES